LLKFRPQYDYDLKFNAKKWRPLAGAHFVTAWAISMKLGVKIPLGNTPRGFFIFVIGPILWPPGGHLENQIFAI
jgi:hypothetical protein